MNVGFLKSNPITSASGIIGTSRLMNRREGTVKVRRIYIPYPCVARDMLELRF